jgi:hypothetical protein
MFTCIPLGEKFVISSYDCTILFSTITTESVARNPISVDVVNLTSTITNEDHILWPSEEVVFTCETIGSVLVNNWTSSDYIGDDISLIFNNQEQLLGNDTRSGSRSIAQLMHKKQLQKLHDGISTSYHDIITISNFVSDMHKF